MNRLANITDPSFFDRCSGLPDSDMHHMQILASCELPKFGSESCPAGEGASPKGARPCPQRARGEGCVTLAFPYDTNCIRIRVQGSCALWAGLCAMWTNFALTAFSEVV